MPDMFLTPPGLTAQMPLDPTQLYFQNRPPPPSQDQLATMNAVGNQIIQEKDTLGRAVDPSTMFGALFLVSGGGSVGVPPPSPSKPDFNLIGAKGPLGVISEPTTSGRGNPWFDVNPIVPFLVNYMNAVRVAMLTKLVDGICAIKSMAMGNELARAAYDVNVAIGELKKEMAMTEAAAMIASGVMSICSAAFSLGTHFVSMAKFKSPEKPMGQAEGSSGGNKPPPKPGEDVSPETPTGLGGVASRQGGPKTQKTGEPEPGVSFKKEDDPLTAGGPGSAKQKSQAEFDKNIQTRRRSEANADQGGEPGPDGWMTNKKGEKVRDTDIDGMEEFQRPDGTIDLRPTPDNSRIPRNNSFENPLYGEGSVSFNQAGGPAPKNAEELQQPAPGKATLNKEQQDKYDADKAAANKQRSDFHTKYATTMASPFFTGMGSIAQGIGKWINAKREEVLGKLQAILEMLHNYQKNAQTVGGSASEDKKTMSDEIDKIFSSLQKLIDENFKAFNINPKG